MCRLSTKNTTLFKFPNASVSIRKSFEKSYVKLMKR